MASKTRAKPVKKVSGYVVQTGTPNQLTAPERVATVTMARNRVNKILDRAIDYGRQFSATTMKEAEDEKVRVSETDLSDFMADNPYIVQVNVDDGYFTMQAIVYAIPSLVETKR